MKFSATILCIAILYFTHQDIKALPWVNTTFEYDSIMDVTYGTGVNFNLGVDTLKMDIYTPIRTDVGETSPRPLIIFLHGGAFLTGTKNDSSITNLSRQFARRGYVAASISYRLGMINDDAAWECNVPDYSCIFATDSAEWFRALYRGIQDTKGAIRYLINRHEQFGIDPNHVFLAGESAGAFLALGAALLDTIAEKRPEAYALADVPRPHQSTWDCTHNMDREFNSAFIQRPDLGSIEGDIEPTNINYTIKGVGNIFGALPADWMKLSPAGKPKPAIYQFHQPCDLVVPFETDRIFYGLSWCLTNGFGCHGIANTPIAHGSKTISDWNTQNNYGFEIQNDFTTTAFPYSFLFGSASCFSQLGSPCHDYDNATLRENNMASFFAGYISIAPVSVDNSITMDELIEVFPNPTNSFITLRNNSYENISYQIVDAMGKVIYNNKMGGNSDEVISLENHPQSVYFLRIMGGSPETVIRRIIKY